MATQGHQHFVFYYNVRSMLRHHNLWLDPSTMHPAEGCQLQKNDKGGQGMRRLVLVYPVLHHRAHSWVTKANPCSNKPAPQSVFQCTFAPLCSLSCVCHRFHAQASRSNTTISQYNYFQATLTTLDHAPLCPSLVCESLHAQAPQQQSSAIKCSMKPTSLKLHTKQQN